MMRKILFVASLAFFLLILLSNNKVFGKEEIVNFNQHSSKGEISRFIQELKANNYSVKYIEEINSLFIYNSDSDIGSKSIILKKYKKIIKSNGESIKVSTNSLLEKEFEDYNWFIRKIMGADIGKKDYSSIKVGVIDSGIDANSVNIDAKNSKNFIDNNNDIRDKTGHGTMVANMINTISPNARISVYKVIDKDQGDSSDIIEAIVEASKVNDIINISLGTYKDVNNVKDKQIIDLYDRAIKYANEHSTMIVTSAGNDGRNLLNNNNRHLPGGHPDVITVGSTLKNDKVANYSNFGENLDIVAPGGYFGEDFDKNQNINVKDMIITKFPEYLEQNIVDKALGLKKGYSLNYGTSLSTPQVTAALVRLKYENPTLNSSEIEKKLYNNALDIEENGKDYKSGYGLLKIK